MRINDLKRDILLQIGTLCLQFDEVICEGFVVVDLV